MALFGAASYGALLKHRQHAQITVLSRAYLMGAAITALASAAISLPITLAEIGGDWSSAFDRMLLWTVLWHTRFGPLYMIRTMGLIALVMTCWRASDQRLLIGVLAALLLVALSFTSHAAAAADDLPSLIARAANDSVHLLATGFWLGSLIVLATLVRAYHADLRNLLAPLRLLSLWGTYAVAVIVVSGILNGFCILPSASLIWRSAYGRLLSIKIAFALGMVALAVNNRWRLLPALENGDSAPVSALARNIATEIALALVVVAIAGFLGSTTPQ
jgi:putative copper resistance protein D